MLKIYDHQENYAATIIKLPTPQSVPGLDNLVQVVVFGNKCLIGKDSAPGDYLYFGPETQLSNVFLKENNLYRHSELNKDPTKKGFFEDNGRVRAVKFKGIISSGFVIPVVSVMPFVDNPSELYSGCVFNEVDGVEICRKYIVPQKQACGVKKDKIQKVIDKVVDNRLAPEHDDTSHLSKNLGRINSDDKLIVSIKTHGTSFRCYNTLTYRKLSIFEKALKWFGFKIQEQEYNYVAASRRVIKSVGFDNLPGKNHYYKEDLWTKVCKENFEGKLNQGEAVYGEIIGKGYDGSSIQKGYTYGLEKPVVQIYRISNINPQGIEIDLPYDQMIQRAKELGVDTVREFFVGNIYEFIKKFNGKISTDYRDVLEEFERIFREKLLDKPSVFDSTVIEEGFCVRIDKYPKPEIYKIKSPLFLLHETKVADSGESNIEEEENVTA